MNRRPWPIVLLAVLQLLSPVLYLAVAALFYGVSFGHAGDEILSLSSDLRKFEIFILPLILGVTILIVRRPGYYFVIMGSVYLIIRSVMEFFASNQTDPVFPLIFTNLLCAAVLVYLLRPKTRNMYFNPRMRWWETNPRYVVNMSASVTRLGAKPMKAEIQNISLGGMGVETLETGFLKDEIAEIGFQHAGAVFNIKAKVIWERPTGGGKQFLGINWADENSNADRSKIRRLVRELKSKGTPTSRRTPART